MNDLSVYFVWAAASYLIGSIPAGDLVSRRSGKNIRDLGTGNPGTANITREIGRKHGITVLILDVIKGSIVCIPTYWLDLPTYSALIPVFFVLFGHFFPIFWRFKGGTGMAVAMGTTLALIPVASLIAALFAILFIRFYRNAPYTGIVCFFVTAVGGWLIYKDLPNINIILIVATAVLIKSFFQYGLNPFANET